MNPSMEGFPVVIELPVAWGEMDALGHVNNAVYFRYFETCRMAYLRKIEFLNAIADLSVGPILASTSCRFRRPLTYPDTVRVGTRVTEIGEDRFTMAYRLISEAQQEVAAYGEGVIVSYDYREGRKAPLPEPVRKQIERLEAPRLNGSGRAS